MIRIVVSVDVAARNGFLHPADERAELGRVFRGRVLRGTPPGEIIQHRAQFEDVVRLVDADLAHEDAAILLQPDEARFLERAKRLAYRSARHAEHRRDLGFAQLRAGRKIAGEDHPLELALHERGQRVRLDQRDRVVIGDGAARHGVAGGTGAHGVVPRARRMRRRASWRRDRGGGAGRLFNMLPLDDGGCRLSTICNRERR